jgi:hypothetical protein
MKSCPAVDSTQTFVAMPLEQEAGDFAAVQNDIAIRVE